ncbi:MAG: peptidylprolyl isomerase [Candidatus Woesearchaeota archaeon]
MIKEKDFIELEYSGRFKDNNELFDTTSEEEAKKEKIHSQNMQYGPATICVGQGHLLKGLEKELVGKEIGKELTINLSAEDAFGKKDVKMLRQVPLNKFQKEGIRPIPGMQVNVDGAIGIVRTVSGGRVIVDFNHPFAGKNVVYRVKVKRKVEDKAEQISSLVQMIFNIKKDAFSAKVENDVATIEMPKLPDEIKQELTKKIKWLVSVKDVKFVDMKERVERQT